MVRYRTFQLRCAPRAASASSPPRPGRPAPPASPGFPASPRAACPRRCAAPRAMSAAYAPTATSCPPGTAISYQVPSRVPTVKIGIFSRIISPRPNPYPSKLDILSLSARRVERCTPKRPSTISEFSKENIQKNIQTLRDVAKSGDRKRSRFFPRG